ncbi:MAG: pyrimidine 5'-nucleotidase [Anaerolineae bacterium]|nr:MAG: pyrimidine 5'-nucleotidase [Anaerolineae bacterium]
MFYSTLFIDLDDTLYPAQNGLWQLIKERIRQYMRERLGIPAEIVPELSQRYFLEYGTTLRGLQANYSVDMLDYLNYVHDVPLQDYLAPNPALRAILDSIPVRKFIFTNADAAHAQRVLTHLGIESCFAGIVDIVAVAPYCKPMPEAFEIARALAGEPDPRRCVMIDDLPRTTRAARACGLCALLYGQAQPHPDADAAFDDWSLLPALLNGRNGCTPKTFGL